MSRRVLITGSSGFIGTNLVDHFLAAGDVICAADLKPPRKAIHAPLWRPLDLTQREAVFALVTEFAPAAILHFGARTDLAGAALSDYAANIEGTANLIDAARAVGGVERIVHASSMLVCRNGVTPPDDTSFCPDTVYGQSKVAMEKLIRAAGGPAWTIVRPTSIWGPWFEAPYRDFFEAVKRGRYMTPSGAGVRKAFGYVGNTVRQVAALLDGPLEDVRGRVFYLADADAPAIRLWAELVAAGWGVKRPRIVPQALLWPVAVAGDALKATRLMRAPPLTTRRLRNMATASWFDTAPIDRLTGPQRFNAAEGTAATIAWLRSAEAR